MLDDFGSLGRCWREADIERTDIETVISDLLDDQSDRCTILDEGAFEIDIDQASVAGGPSQSWKEIAGDRQPGPKPKIGMGDAS